MVLEGRLEERVSPLSHACTNDCFFSNSADPLVVLYLLISCIDTSPYKFSWVSCFPGYWEWIISLWPCFGPEFLALGPLQPRTWNLPLEINFRPWITCSRVTASQQRKSAPWRLFRVISCCGAIASYNMKSATWKFSDTVFVFHSCCSSGLEVRCILGHEVCHPKNFSHRFFAPH